MISVLSNTTATTALHDFHKITKASHRTAYKESPSSSEPISIRLSTTESSDLSGDSLATLKAEKKQHRTSLNENASNSNRRARVKPSVSHYPSQKFRSSSSSGSSSSMSTLIVNAAKSDEIWIDGPKEKETARACRHITANLVLTPPDAVKITKEVWIDGPNAELDTIKSQLRATNQTSSSKKTKKHALKASLGNANSSIQMHWQ